MGFNCTRQAHYGVRAPQGKGSDGDGGGRRRWDYKQNWIYLRDKEPSFLSSDTKKRLFFLPTDGDASLNNEHLQNNDKSQTVVISVLHRLEESQLR